MKMISQENNDLIKITVQKLEKEASVKELLALLVNNKKIEINFLNVHIIPKKIILRLDEIKQNVKIFTNDIILKTYLVNLGFTLKYLNNYKKEKKAFNLEYIAIGGSAGSLSRFCEIVENLPKSNISLFFIMHQKADEKSNLAKLLQAKTKNYKVIEAKSDMKIEPSTIYTAPPGKHLIVIGDFIFLSHEKKINYSRPSISVAFDYLSKEYRSSLLLILISGYGSDGSDSLKNAKNNESRILIQDPNDCEEKPMLENAIKTGNYDEILSIKKICEYISEHSNNKEIQKEDIIFLLENIYSKYGYDYRGYNLNHIKRRVKLFYYNLKPKNFTDFVEIILNNKNIFKDLFLNISVNITTFYRNPNVFKSLREEVLPKLDSFVDIKIWCAGCSSGEEPYSIAIFLKELGLLNKSLIYATDLNDVILKNAQNALYSKESYNTFLKNYYKAGGDESFSSYFNTHDNFVELKDEIKENILFFRHNLDLDAKINDFQLIFCRNVLIYFDPKLKNKVFDLFKESLDSYGFLVLGESESLTNKSFKNIDKKNRIYKRL